MALRWRTTAKATDAAALLTRTDKTLAEGVDKMEAIAAKMNDLKVTDRSLIWNSDLMETLESFVSRTADFEITDHQVKFYGYCSECRKRDE